MRRFVCCQVVLLLCALLCVSCARKLPSASRHFAQNYNFVVAADSMPIIKQLPAEAVSGMPVDTLAIYHGELLVVADFDTLKADTADSIWVQVARDEETVGWLHESELLKLARPNSPVSQFIDFFADYHLLLLLALLVLVGIVVALRRQALNGLYIVHFHDIPSVYPALLCVLVAASAVFYSTIQMVDPDSWSEFYFHPTLNPFVAPLHLALFLGALWSIFIVGVAAFSDIVRQQSTGQALFYLLSLACICAVVYVLFSLSTFCYLGYPLLLVYAVFAFRRYFRHSRARYVCGYCGHQLREKGVCPHCGAVNQ